VGFTAQALRRAVVFRTFGSGIFGGSYTRTVLILRTRPLGALDALEGPHLEGRTADKALVWAMSFWLADNDVGRNN
jgi:hypothetical protein